MNNFLLIVAIIVAIYGVYNIMRPIFIGRKLRAGYQVMFLAPKSVYFFIIIFVLATITNVLLYIHYNYFIFLFIASICFTCGCTEFSKSYMIFLHKGWFIDGTYFALEEVVNHGEFYILPHLNFRSIFKVATKNKKSYGYVCKKKESIINSRIKSMGIVKS